MRWKFSGSGHDPRQIDLLAIFALLVIISGAYVYFAHYAATPQNTTAFKPKRALVDSAQALNGTRRRIHVAAAARPAPVAGAF